MLTQTKRDMTRSPPRVCAGYHGVDGPLVHIKPGGAIGLHSLPVASGKAVLGTGSDFAEFILKLIESQADFAGQRVG